MLRPAFTISHDRRRPMDEAGTWEVRGNCEPEPYDSLAGARLFTQRENEKYRNGSVRPFVPTHMILWQPPQSPAVKRRIPVRWVWPRDRRVDDLVALYEQEEWQPCVIPEWQYNPTTDRLLLDEVLMGFSWRLLNYEDALANFAVLTISDTRDQVRFRSF